MNRPALIFDFGNVIASFDWRRAAEAIGRRLRISADDYLDRARDRGLSALSTRYERGDLTTEAFSAEARGLIAEDLAHDEFAAAWADIFSLNEPVARLIADLKAKGYTLVLGSNTNELHATHFKQEFAEALAPFDRLVLSFEVRHLKPSAAFYLACAEAAGRPPGDCVFIDDLPENVEGARAAGLLGLVFRDEPTLREDLRQLGVEVGPS